MDTESRDMKTVLPILSLALFLSPVLAQTTGEGTKAASEVISSEIVWEAAIRGVSG
jgi:hypothetical protein